jgi:hypothetical protein
MAGGQLRPALDRLKWKEALSLLDLAQQCRKGKEALRTKQDIPHANETGAGGLLMEHLS